MNKQRKFPKEIPAGNYSGITPIGDDRYAVVSDKSADGFFVFHIDIDTVKGRITGVTNEGFRASGLPNRDQEGIAFQPSTQTLYIAGEADNRVMAYGLDGQRTGRELQVPASFGRLHSNYGLEALCYDSQARLFYAMSERPAAGDSVIWLSVFDDEGRIRDQYTYRLDDVPKKRKGTMVNGVSELCAIGDGKLLVLERTVRVPKLKIGSYVACRLYEVSPADDVQLHKNLVCSFRTKINLTRRNFANYEGMCVAKRLNDGRKIVLLIADSQNQYRGILRDWLKTIVIK